MILFWNFFKKIFSLYSNIIIIVIFKNNSSDKIMIILLLSYISKVKKKYGDIIRNHVIYIYIIK